MDIFNFCCSLALDATLWTPSSPVTFHVLEDFGERRLVVVDAVFVNGVWWSCLTLASNSQCTKG